MIKKVVLLLFLGTFITCINIAVLSIAELYTAIPNSLVMALLIVLTAFFWHKMPPKSDNSGN